MADLKGKKVGVTRGGPQELLLIAELNQHGLSWSDKPGKDVQIVYMVYPDLNQAIAGGNLDVISQSEPYASQLLNKGLATEVIKPYDTPLGEPMRALVMSEKFYKEKPDVALRTMKAFVEATRLFIADSKLAESYVRNTMFKGQITEQDFQDAMNNASFTTDLSVEQVDVTTRLMQETGVGRMPAPPVAAEWVKVDLLEKAKAALGK
ncbi:MAG: ABC transporter substrate-binding protein [Magnetospirillum sp.]|nr:ABC transporter substrate-binding protein [Magnetospirillum sp.]